MGKMINVRAILARLFRDRKRNAAAQAILATPTAHLASRDPSRAVRALRRSVSPDLAPVSPSWRRWARMQARDEMVALVSRVEMRDILGRAKV